MQGLVYGRLRLQCKGESAGDAQGEKITGGAPEIPSDKNLTLLTF